MWGCTLDAAFLQCAVVAYPLSKFVFLMLALSALMTVVVVVTYQVGAAVLRLAGLSFKPQPEQRQDYTE